MSYFYKASEVKKAIGDRWYEVLAELAPELTPAIEKAGRHTYCPVHGGKNGDAFRFFRKDGHLTGGAICNTCGPRNDGFELLQWVKGWDFKTTLTAVGDFIGAPRYSKKRGHTNSANRLRQKGVILAHGAAPYNFNSKNTQSYFIQVLSKHGEAYVWGVDLERALNKAKADVDDFISIYSLGREKVKVPLKNENGEVIDGQKSYYRNTFEIVVEEKALKAQPVTQPNHSRPQPEQLIRKQQPKQQNRPRPTQQANSPKQSRQRFSQQSINQPRKQFRPTINQPNSKPERQKKSYALRRLEKLWDDSFPLNSHLASKAHDYFSARGFVMVMNEVAKNDEIRFHPNLDYFAAGSDGKTQLVGKFPALIAAIRNLQGDLITLHRTYLFPENRDFGPRKKMMPLPDGVSLSGSAIQLAAPVEGVLGVAEGIETALACMYACELPVWASVSAQFMASFEVPDDVHTVIIWADKDKSCTGERVAHQLKRKLTKEGVKTVVALPQLAISNGKSVDWNDVLLEQGRIAFPNPVELRKFLGI